MRRSRSIGGNYRLPNGQEVTSLVKSIQRGTITIAGGTSSNTATLATEAALDRSRLRHVGYDTQGGESNARNRLTFTNTTTITANRQGTAADTIVSYEVTEYPHGLFRSIQRGSITIGPAAASNTATITAVNTAKSEVSCLGFQTDESAETDQFPRLALTNGTTITATRANAGAGSTIVNYEVAEYR